MRQLDKRGRLVDRVQLYKSDCKIQVYGIVNLALKGFKNIQQSD